MCQVLDDFLGVLCLACSRLAPAKRVEGVLSEICPGLHPSYSVCCCLPLCPLVGTHEGANRRKGEQQTKCEALGSSLSLFPMAHERPDQGRSITTVYPGHLAAFRAKCFRHQGQAAVDLGAKVTYMCSPEISLGGGFLSKVDSSQYQPKSDKEGHSQPEGVCHAPAGGSCWSLWWSSALTHPPTPEGHSFEKG